jgi:hypothetical protein
MKAFKMLKIAVLSLLFFLIPLNASINKYVISDDAVIDARTAQKILEIGSEVNQWPRRHKGKGKITSL